MKQGDRVKVKPGHPRAGLFGNIKYATIRGNIMYWMVEFDLGPNSGEYREEELENITKSK